MQLNGMVGAYKYQIQTKMETGVGLRVRKAKIKNQKNAQK
jgi:hypothetical protein